MAETTDTVLRAETQTALTVAQNTMVRSADDYIAAGNARKEIKYTIKRISDYWTPKKDQAYQLHKSLVAAEKEMTAPLEQADKLLDQRMGEYRREQERIRMEAEREQRRREEEARKAAEEAARLAAEAAQKDELDEDDAEILMMAQADVDRAELAVDASPLPVAPLKMEGISVAKIWKARVVNELIVPIMVGRVVLRPIDMVELNRLAKTGIDVPGVEFYQEESTRVRL